MTLKANEATETPANIRLVEHLAVLDCSNDAGTHAAPIRRMATQADVNLANYSNDPSQTVCVSVLAIGNDGRLADKQSQTYSMYVCIF